MRVRLFRFPDRQGSSEKLYPYTCVEITNYCTQQIEFVNGFPVTSKGDTKFHGFGVKSMEYVVEKYGGNMVIQYQQDTFLVKIIFPLPRGKAM